MSEDRKKPGVAFWATVMVVAALVGYPLSFGPACWINQRTGLGKSVISTVYRPFLRMAGRQFGYPGIYRTPANRFIVWYARLGINGDDWPYGHDEIGWAALRGSTTW